MSINQPWWITFPECVVLPENKKKLKKNRHCYVRHFSIENPRAVNILTLDPEGYSVRLTQSKTNGGIFRRVQCMHFDFTMRYA